MLRCSSCKEYKPTNEFHAANSKGHKNRAFKHNHCKTCILGRIQATRNANKQANLCNCRTDDNRISINTEVSTAYCSKCYIYTRERGWSRAGIDITFTIYYNMLERQGYRCLICSQNIHITSANVDHNHRTGIIRGILCSRCNTHLEFTETHYEKIINYLK